MGGELDVQLPNVMQSKAKKEYFLGNIFKREQLLQHVINSIFQGKPIHRF
ncbi:hypothetical protein [Paenibacillus sp. FSL H8-0537]